MTDQEEFDFGDNVEVSTFEQILEMDDEEEADPHEFSRSIVFGYLEQAQTTFEKMDGAVENENLEELSGLGHFLKGSSATLGFTKVKDECEKIQHYGHQKDETGTIDEPDKAKCLRKIAKSISQAKKDFTVVEMLMKEYYNRLSAQ